MVPPETPESSGDPEASEGMNAFDMVRSSGCLKNGPAAAIFLPVPRASCYPYRSEAQTCCVFLSDLMVTGITDTGNVSRPGPIFQGKAA